MDFKDSNRVLARGLPFTVSLASNSRRLQDGKCAGLRVNFHFGAGVNPAEQVLCRQGGDNEPAE